MQKHRFSINKYKKEREEREKMRSRGREKERWEREARVWELRENDTIETQKKGNENKEIW